MPHTLLNQEIVRMGLESTEHLEIRFKNEESWKLMETKNLQRRESVKRNHRARATLGYLPTKIYKRIQQHIKQNTSGTEKEKIRLADKIAMKLVVMQMDCWRKIKLEYWKERFKKLENGINLVQQVLSDKKPAIFDPPPHFLSPRSTRVSFSSPLPDQGLSFIFLTPDLRPSFS